MMISVDLVKYLFIDEMALIVLHPIPIKKQVGGLTAVFVLLSMRHGVSLKDDSKTLFGLIEKAGVKL